MPEPSFVFGPRIPSGAGTGIAARPPRITPAYAASLRLLCVEPRTGCMLS